MNILRRLVGREPASDTCGGGDVVDASTARSSATSTATGRGGAGEAKGSAVPSNRDTSRALHSAARAGSLPGMIEALDRAIATPIAAALASRRARPATHGEVLERVHKLDVQESSCILTELLSHVGGGPRSAAWLGCLSHVLQSASTPLRCAMVRATDSQWRTPLHAVCVAGGAGITSRVGDSVVFWHYAPDATAQRRREARRAGRPVPGRLAAVVALLVCGARANAKDMVRGRACALAARQRGSAWALADTRVCLRCAQSGQTPRALLSDNRERLDSGPTASDRDDTAAVALLERAERVGGPAAVEEWLARGAARAAAELLDCAGWHVVAPLVRPAVSRCMLLSRWAAGRERARQGRARARRGATLAVWEGVPRAALAEVFLQLG